MKTLALLPLATLAHAADLTAPIAGDDLVFAEKDGIVAIEAEHFIRHELTDTRAWYLTTRDTTPDVPPDGDPSHIAGASGGAYLEILPDTRRTHDDKLIQGENFSNEPGKLAVLSYRVHFDTPGTYWLWARACSTTSEDNGLHFGINGEWPPTARRWQTVTRNRWHWKSAQRTQEVHVGVPGILTLEVPAAGEHTIQVSMREDGIALDKILLAHRKDFTPEGLGPEPVVKSGTLPEAYPFVASMNKPADLPLHQPRGADGDGSIQITGELKQWHKLTLTLDGPFAHELHKAPNPFTDRSFWVTFAHESGEPEYTVPGYFAADGDASESSAASGTKWRAHLSPSKTGSWTYTVHFRSGKASAFSSDSGEPLAPYHGKSGNFTVAASDKQAPDFRARGRLAYVGKHHLQFQGDRSYFLKAGPDAPETLLAYADFDGTSALKPDKSPIKTWQAHLRDWQPGDPVWKSDKGKGLIGALNYLAAEGLNSFSFLPYNVDGDGSNVWPFTGPRDKFHYDCSKLDQWGIVFDHATAKGLHLHFKLQENEIDDDRLGHQAKAGRVPASLDGGKLGPERMLYCREIVARFGHALALNWNIGEESTQSPEEIKSMIDYLRGIDPYDHHVVLHTFPDQQDRKYGPLLGYAGLTGASLQNHWKEVHRLTAKWRRASAEAGHPWVCANDEQNPAGLGVPPDPGYPGKTEAPYSIHDIRKHTLWGNLMAGGAGVEYYFGYQLAENDLVAEDFRSRDQSWDFCRIALSFFAENEIPFHEMETRDKLVGKNARCLARDGGPWVIQLPAGGTTRFEKPTDSLTLQWLDPRSGELSDAQSFSSDTLQAPGEGDWVALLRNAAPR